MKTMKYVLFATMLVFACCDKDDDSINTIPVVSTTEVTEITTTTALSGGNITDDRGATVTVRGVCWSTGQNPTISDSKSEGGTGAGSFTSSISGLEPNSTYYVKAYATNSAGTGYGSAMSFTTQEGFTDARDGNVYQTVTIGNQVWMAENLKYLPSVIGPASGSATTPYYYVYQYGGTNVADAKATANYSTYGVLYNWSAATNACPAGWHLPSDAEWRQLSDYLGGHSVSAGKLKETGTTHWLSPNTGATNETGFTALPGGFRYSNGVFEYVGNNGFWWTATESDALSMHGIDISYEGSNMRPRPRYSKQIGFSVRCLRD